MEEHAHPEFTIIKRRSVHEAEHHGGAWKIAFADFMTAMMAFFLVLWIISATDKDTKTIIARYFNPVKLEETSRTPKSIHGDGTTTPAVTAPGITPNPDPKVPGQTETELPPNGKSDVIDATNGLVTPDPNKSGAAANLGDPASPKATMTEGVLFLDPYKSLDIIAGPTSPDELAIMQRDKAEGVVSDADGLADPFRPVASRPNGEPRPPQGVASPAAAATPAPQTQSAGAPTPAPTATPGAAPAPGETTAPAAAAAAASVVAPAPTPTPAPTPGPLEAKPSASVAARLQKELELQIGAPGDKQLGPAIEVKATDEGLLITLTDKLNYSMFALGSAEPQPKVIQAMDAVAHLLKARPGLVVVRGHTDGHPYRSATYDNWRLSSARAQMAYYMLTRAGLPESRFERIEGYGEKGLRDPDHPFAAENRRIEVLLKEDKP